MTHRYITHTPHETEQVGQELAALLQKPCVIAFTGTLGAGKTTFVRGLADGLGYKGEVSSPTFAIVHEYEGGRLPLYHFDMYRIESVEDLYSCGYFDYEGYGVLAIEWSENIAEALPPGTIFVHLSYGTEDDSRTIVIEENPV